MWPRNIPPAIRKDRSRRAECRVFDKLEKILDDSYSVFYSRPWTGTDKNGTERDGECDFLIAHPVNGILVIEVKGGGVSRNPETDEWSSIDHMGFHNRIKDPVLQCRNSKYTILKKLKGFSELKRRRFNIKCGVILPDSRHPEEELGIGYPIEIFCFLEEFSNGFLSWIQQRMAGNEPDEFGIDGINILTDILAKKIVLHVPPGHILNEVEESIYYLTVDQYHILEEIEEIDRVVISGGAGTGKTVLAIEEGIRLASQGISVLITCLSVPLANYIRQKLTGYHNITVLPFHKLCGQYIKNADLEIPGNVSLQHLLRITYPDLLPVAINKTGGPYFGAIIVDEGQDFLPNWWLALESLIDKSGSTQKIRVFYDSNQKIFGKNLKIPPEFRPVPIRLVQNLRNTKNIFRYVNHFYEGHKIKTIGPEGPEVEYLVKNSYSEIKQVIKEKIQNFISKGDISPEQIAILVPDDKCLDKFFSENTIAGYSCAKSYMPKRNAIVIDTIRKFKGLESPVVFLLINSEILEREDLLYVGLSRASTYLFICGDSSGTEYINKIMKPD
ncbi:NERD domain-containing protein/DEAD/DEAH box helicase [Methanospirillum sp.]|uniref:nuclease-related domain-containing DEAD/DEAH box helicase n=2 Tax=Methanospirillum sp. TaxID=45200 RepID=UPI002BAE2508|nr:NERD domain-containing protein/DEAD/DEAH box helicase [Methanospirillum sp.]HPP77530.1 NERD domain-containing protein/DEAD/DEAH box helicase [Methanospirillum sp.]